MPGAIFPFVPAPRVRTEEELARARLCHILDGGRQPVQILPRGGLHTDQRPPIPRPEPAVVVEARRRALARLRLKSGT